MYLSVFLLGVVVASVVVFVIVIGIVLVARGLLARVTPQRLPPRTNFIILCRNFVAASPLLRLLLHVIRVVVHVPLLLVPTTNQVKLPNHLLVLAAFFLGSHHVFTDCLHEVFVFSHLLERFVH
jgi:hypothetical protein